MTYRMISYGPELLSLEKNMLNIELFKLAATFFTGVAITTASIEPKTQYVSVPVERTVVVHKPVYIQSPDKKQIQCLADNIYYEARNQSKIGQIAVTNVVMNRVKDGRFPKTPCSVINQKRGGICQFSWVCSSKQVKNTTSYKKAYEVAENVYINNERDVTNNALFYHATYVRPSWARKFRQTARIGSHIFYYG